MYFYWLVLFHFTKIAFFHSSPFFLFQLLPPSVFFFNTFEFENENDVCAGSLLVAPTLKHSVVRQGDREFEASLAYTVFY